MPASTVNIKAYMETVKKETDALLERYLPLSSAPPQRLHEAMRYSTLAGGKRLRPILAHAAYDYCKGSWDSKDLPIHYAMAALEMVHTYSLIHDDLPCMDDDDLRRGIPTCHKKFDEATAVLAGDALHDVAFHLLAETGNNKVVVELAKAIGTQGMIGGQMADVEAEGIKPDKATVINIHRRKTGALIRASVRIGAILAGADKPTFESLSSYGEKIGLAFQIIDDILDVEGETELLGKSVGSDTAKAKATYPKVVGLEQAHLDASSLIEEAVALFQDYTDNTLIHLARYICQRKN